MMEISNMGQIQELMKRCSENLLLQEVQSLLTCSQVWEHVSPSSPPSPPLWGILRFRSLERGFPAFWGVTAVIQYLWNHPCLRCLNMNYIRKIWAEDTLLAKNVAPKPSIALHTTTSTNFTENRKILECVFPVVFFFCFKGNIILVRVISTEVFIRNGLRKKLDFHVDLQPKHPCNHPWISHSYSNIYSRI